MNTAVRTATLDANWYSVARRSSAQQSMSVTSTNACLSSSKASSQRMASRIESGTATLVLHLESGWVRAGFTSAFGASDDLFPGYGATTFPALTESITIENNATQAEYEVKRLETLVDGIIKRIGHRTNVF